MVKLLLKKEMAAVWRTYLINPRTSKPRSKGRMILMFVLFALLMVGLIGGMFTMLAVFLCRPLVEAGVGWLYYILMGSLALVLGVFGSSFNTFSSLYLAKDNDVLLSLPIPVKAILASRLINVYLLSLMYSGVAAVPAVIVRWVTVGVTPGVLIGGILFIWNTSILVTVLSCILGWVIAKASTKLKHRSFTTVILALAIFGFYYFMYFKAFGLVTEMVQRAGQYGTRIRASAYPLYAAGRAAEGSPLAAMIVTVICAALFGVVWLVLSRTFTSIVTSTGAAAHRKYQAKAVKQESPARALIGRELAHLTSSASYMLNCAIGTIILPVIGVVFLINHRFMGMITEEFGIRHQSVAALICVVVCVLAGMNNSAAPSVSLEGKHLWIVKSLPVTAEQVLLAKGRLQILLTVPGAIFCAVCAAVSLGLGIADTLIVILNASAFSVMIGLWDLRSGIRYANFNWTSETGPMKQSMAAFMALIGAWGLPILAFFGSYPAVHIMTGELYLLLITAVYIILAVIFRRWILTKGIERFEQL